MKIRRVVPALGSFINLSFCMTQIPRARPQRHPAQDIKLYSGIMNHRPPNNALLRPYLLGGVALGGVPLDFHEVLMRLNLFGIIPVGFIKDNTDLRRNAPKQDALFFFVCVCVL